MEIQGEDITSTLGGRRSVLIQIISVEVQRAIGHLYGPQVHEIGIISH
jgi:hypothetical protein